MIKVLNKVYTNEHPKVDRVDPERIELASGISFRDLKNLSGNTIQEKLEKKLGIKVHPKITLKEALKLLQKHKVK